MRDRGHLTTETPNPASAALDALPLADAFDVMNAEDRRIPDAIAAAKPAILAAIERVVAALRAGGRLIYLGAGTSGRLGVLDAAECPPTFLTDPDMVQGVIAGGVAALTRAIENAEDDPDAGAAAVDQLRLSERDVLFGITTGGTTPYVHGAIGRAKQRGAATVFFACVPADQAPDDADVSIRVLTGPEIITGSTRLKAGIATKMTLNMISTLAMTRLGKVYGNLMVDVNALGCEKLRDRATRIVMRLTELPREQATAALEAADWSVKAAVLMARTRVSLSAAREQLTRHAGDLRAALGELASGRGH